MARYWVGGTGNWSDATNHWATTSGGAPGAGNLPTATEDVFFDSASHTTSYTVTIDATTKLCRDLTFAAPASGNVTWAGSVAMTISGSMTLYSGLVRSYTGALTFNATTGTKTITTAGKTLRAITLNGSGGTFQLVDNLSFDGNSPNWLTVTNGTLDCTTNSVTVTLTSIGNATYTLTSTNALTFYNLTFTGAAAAETVFTLGNNITVTNNFVHNGFSVANRSLLGSSVVGTPRTITAANVSMSYADLKDIVGAGAGSWNLAAITGLSGDCGGNSGITFTTPATQTFTNTSGGSWLTPGNWSGRIPLPQDDVSLATAFTTSRTVTMDMPRAGKSIDLTGATWTTSFTLNMGGTVSIFGSLTLIAGITLTLSTNTFSFEGRSSYTFDSAGFTFEKAFALTAPGGTLTLASNFTMGVTRTLTINNGTFDTGSSVLSVGLLTVQAGGTMTFGNQTHFLTGVGSVFGSNTAATINANNSIIKITDTSNSAITFSSGLAAGKTFYDVWFDRGASTGNITIGSPNTFHDFKDTGTAAHSILFTAGITTTVTTFTVSGTAGNLITINSTTTGTHTLSAPSKNNASPISCDYLNIQHSIVLQANTWYAGVNSVNNQATATAGSGWIFTDPVLLATDTSSFFQLF